ncbi:MAG: CDP-alcohol phosphatidyltransferase family protein [bacterium]|nr:CDP-alcohol phosphatidyltransferase family protein [bacterium]
MHIWIDARSPYAFEKIYSLTLIERLLRQLFELGIRERVTVMLELNLSLKHVIRSDFWRRYPLGFETADSDACFTESLMAAQKCNHSFMLLEGDGIYDERILKTLIQTSRSLLISDERQGAVPIAMHVQPGDLHHLRRHTMHIRDYLQPEGRGNWLTTLSVHDMDSYIPALRQTAVPFLTKLQDQACIRNIENEMYEQTFKGVMDFIATYVYRIPVRELVRWLAPTRVTPNHITTISVVCSLGALPLFVTGWLWAGLIVAFIFIIADSLDGKLARLTIRLSPVAGHVDHITSPLFEAGYYVAWGWHFSAGDFTALAGRAGWLLFAFFGLDRIVTSIFGLRFHRSLLDYKEWDARFHLIAGRRTVNLFIMTLGCMVQKPIIALYIITVWMFITMLWHMVRYALHAYQNEAGSQR